MKPIPSIFIEKQIKISAKVLFARFNDILREDFKNNNFNFLSSGNMIREDLLKDVIQLYNEGSHLFVINTADLNDLFLNMFL